MAKVVLLACTFASVSGISSIAYADANGKALAARNPDAGTALFPNGDHKGAIDAFRLAYANFPSPKILINIASALEALGRHAEAADAYDRFGVETAQSTDITNERKISASNALARLVKRVARLRLEVPGTAAVVLDGQPIILRNGRPTYVTPGIHRISASGDGFVTKVLDLELAAGEEKALAISLEAVPVAEPVEPPKQVEPVVPPRAPDSVVVAPAPPPSTAVALEATTTDRAGHRKWPWIAGAAGGFAITATVFGLRVRSGYSEYEQASDADRYDELRKQVSRDATLANVLFVGAGAAAIVAGVMYVVENRGGPQVVRNAVVMPIGEGGLAVAAHGRF